MKILQDRGKRDREKKLEVAKNDVVAGGTLLFPSSFVFGCVCEKKNLDDDATVYRRTYRL